MRVLLISSKYPPEYAGSGLRAFNTYERLSRKYGIEYDVICNSVEFNGNKQYCYEGLNIQRISSSFFAYLPEKQNKIVARYNLFGKYFSEALLTVKKLIKKDYDFIHSFGNSSSVATAAYISHLLRKPMIIELCNRLDDPHPYLPLFSRFCKPDLSKGKVIVAISGELKEVCDRYGYTENVWCRPNPIDRSHFYVRSKSEKALLRKKMSPFKEEDIILTFVAKFWPQKNHIFLLDVLSRLSEKYKLILAGPVISYGRYKTRDHNYLIRVKEKIEESRLTSRVRLIVEKVDMAEYLAITDVFLLPSWNEALSSPMIESLGCGVPVVANIGESAFRQWIRDGKNGYLCELNADKWAEAVIKTSIFEDVRRRNISEDIYKHASADVIDENYYKIIKSLLEVGHNGKINVMQVIDDGKGIFKN